VVAPTIRDEWLNGRLDNPDLGLAVSVARDAVADSTEADLRSIWERLLRAAVDWCNSHEGEGEGDWPIAQPGSLGFPPDVDEEGANTYFRVGFSDFFDLFVVGMSLLNPTNALLRGLVDEFGESTLLAVILLHDAACISSASPSGFWNGGVSRSAKSALKTAVLLATLTRDRKQEARFRELLFDSVTATRALVTRRQALNAAEIRHQSTSRVRAFAIDLYQQGDYPSMRAGALAIVEEVYQYSRQHEGGRVFKTGYPFDTIYRWIRASHRDC